MRGLKRISAALLCGAVLLCGCENNDVPSELVVSEITVSEETPFPAVSCGETLDKAVEKAVSLSPAATEIICELGFGDKLVGISDYCDYPENLTVPKVGSTENPDLEGIIKLSPDAVFTLSELSERDKYELNRAGIKVLTCKCASDLESYGVMYREFATAFYGNEKSGSLKDETKPFEAGKNARSALEKAAENVKLKKFVYVTRKLTFAGNSTFENAVLGLCGENICTESGYVEASALGQPDFIIADNELSEAELNENSVISAMIDGGAEVKFVNAEHFSRPSARTSEIFGEISGQAE